MSRFSIRDLLLLTLVVGTGIGWLVNHRAMKNEHHRLELENEYLKDELLELRFPTVQQDQSQVVEEHTHTLEWYPPLSN